MTRTNHKKRMRIPRFHPSFPNEKEPIMKAHVWGTTERILRRNRKFWSRALGKLRRAHDKKVIREESD